MPAEKKIKGMVVTPYINTLTERVQRVYKKDSVNVAMKPYNAVRNLLVHPKDKRESTNAVLHYEIGCKNCDQT